MVRELGAGLYLDEYLDFSVDTTGDLRGASGVSELEKDLAIQMILGLDQYVGQPPSGNLEEKVAATARAIAEADVRVASVRTGLTEVDFSSDRQEITINMTVVTDDGEQNLVFDV